MIPRGGKFAKSVVNFVHKTPQNWEKFKSAIQQIDDVLKKENSDWMVNRRLILRLIKIF